MAKEATVGATGNKKVTEITIGVGANRKVTEGWIGTASGNRQFFSSAPSTTATAGMNVGQWHWAIVRYIVYSGGESKNLASAIYDTHIGGLQISRSSSPLVMDGVNSADLVVGRNYIGCLSVSNYWTQSWFAPGNSYNMMQGIFSCAAVNNARVLSGSYVCPVNGNLSTIVDATQRFVFNGSTRISGLPTNTAQVTINGSTSTQLSVCFIANTQNAFYQQYTATTSRAIFGVWQYMGETINGSEPRLNPPGCGPNASNQTANNVFLGKFLRIA